MKIKRSAMYCVVVMVPVGIGHAFADEPSVQPTVEVTASRIEQPLSQTLADVSVITRADIEASNAPDLIEILRLQAGVDIARTGGAGQQTGVFLRGSNSNHVLVLVDGVRVASANTGAFAFENLPLDAVERVEIVRGARASYWGSDAIGGVIQIFTRRLDGLHAAASVGSYGSADGSVGYGRQTDRGGFSVQVGARHVDGFSASNKAAGPFVYNPDDNGFQNHNAVVRGDYVLGTQTLSGTLLRSEGSVSFDNGDPGKGSSRMLDQAIGLNLEGAVTDAWRQRLSLGTSRENIDTEVFGSAYRSTRQQLGWTNDVALTATQSILAGVDYLHDHGLSLDTFGDSVVYEKSRDTAGAFAGWRASTASLESELTARYDHNDSFGGAFSGSAAGGWRVADELRLSASYGTAFRAPTLNELYSPGYGGYYAGNPLLDPERSRTGEVGLTWKPSGANQLDVRAFSTRVHDLIDFTGGTTFQAVNVAHAAIDGVELTHVWRSSGWSWTNTVTYQDPRNADTDAQLLRRPKKKFNSVLQTSLSERMSAGVEFVASGPSLDTGDITLGGYSIVNLRANYTLTSNWTLGARIENVLDRDYEIVHGYNTSGAAGYLTITYAQ